MTHSTLTRSLMATLLAAASLCAQAQDADVPPTGPRKAERYTVLLNAKHLVLSTEKNNKVTNYLYIISSEQRALITLADDSISVGSDKYARGELKSMRFRNVPRLFLDEDSTKHGTDYAVNHGLLALRRTFRLGGWNTLVLPISLTGQQVREVFGSNAQLARVRGAETADEVTIEFDTIDLDTDDMVLQANFCYMIRPTREPDIAANRSNTNILSTRVYGPVYLLQDISMPAGQTPSITTIRDQEQEVVARMRGTYARLDNTVMRSKTLIENKMIAKDTWSFNGDGIIMENTDSTLLQAYRCWFQNMNSEKKLRFVINGVEDELNGIPNAIATPLLGQSQTTGDVYDLQGRRVATLREDERIDALDLPRGVYIIRGRKVVVSK